ncbi:MAG: non-ribosomal peptide synthetase, partial [Myxococcota bacterium]
VMYTSGSTGQPKGVAIPNRGILRLVVDSDFMTINGDTSFAQLSAQTFDAATLEIWAPLLNGGRCVLLPSGELPDLDMLGDAIRAHRINSMWLTASLFNFVVDNALDLLRPLTSVLTGGEALSVAHVVKANRELPDTQLINGYGPTENTTFTTCYAIPKSFPATAHSVPIGRPISGTTIRIDPVEGVEDGAGELVAMGLGVARGYVGREEETRQRFVFDGERAVAYRTGDLVRETETGLIEFVGRVDDQVKINGHRIEPGEVDTVAQTLPGIAQCRTVLRQSGTTKKLVAYYVGTAEPETLRGALREKLPTFMVPAHLVPVASLPFNENHKLDLSHLPDPLAAVAPARAAGRTLVDEISAIWRNAVPGITEFGPDDNFFDVGGSSVDALIVAKHCEVLVGREVSAVKAFEFPTVRALARYLEHGTTNTEGQAESRAARRRSALKKKRARR